MKKTMVFAIILVLGTFLIGSVFAGGQRAASVGPMTPAAQIQPPPGKKPLSLPVDQVSSKNLRIAAIMVQNNPFGVALMQG